MKKIFQYLPIIGKIIKQRNILLSERDNLKRQLNQCKENINSGLYYPGHFYSPIPDKKDITLEKYNKVIKSSFKLKAVDLNEKYQLELIKIFSKFYPPPFKDKKINKFRYYYQNPNFSYGDAISLYSIIRFFKPKKIIEIGSGFSSCVILDTNEFFFKEKIKIEFIEPFPDLFFSLIKNKDKLKNKIIVKKLQEINPNYFKTLKENDILFIDGTHVSKFNSDVNYIFFKILPILNKGVIIHFHDIFYPFEYPLSWLEQGIYWNEIYLLNAFLQYNNSFKIIFFNNYLYYKYKKILFKNLPLYKKNPGGSIYIKKIK